MKNKLRVCAISDTHGKFPKLHGRFDCVVFAGDFFPNSIEVMNKNIVKENSFQLSWLEDNISYIKKWLGGKDFLFTLGNHDFINHNLVAQTLQSEGINAINLTDKIISYNNFNFYGFPYVPTINNFWNYEKNQNEMELEVDKLIKALISTKIDMIVAHSPLFNCLDHTYRGDFVGNLSLLSALKNLNKNQLPNYYLCGHIHESSGVKIMNNMVCINASNQVIIEMDKNV